MLPYEQKRFNLLNKRCFYGNNKNVLRYQQLKHVFECWLSALIDTGPKSFCYMCRGPIALPTIRCLKSAQIRCSGVATVVYGNHTAAYAKPI